MAKSEATDRPVALVTGAGAPRIGQAVARALAARGYDLVVHAYRSVREAEQLAQSLSQGASRAVALSADLRDEASTGALIEQAHAQFGRIDALVNSAAIWEAKPLEDITPDDVRRHFEINTLATFQLCQRVGLLMVKQPAGGAIVNIGDWAIDRPYLNYAAYFPSKGAIPTLTRCLAVELGTRNPKVRVNAVLPGPVMLPAEMPPAEKDSVIAQTLVRREGSPQDVAGAVEFLLGNEFVTGVCLRVDGGRTIYAGTALDAASLAG